MNKLSTLRALLALTFVLAAPAAVQAIPYTKANNTNSLEQAISWGGISSPGSGDTASWSGPYTANATTNSLSAVFPKTVAPAWGGISIGAVSGPALTTNIIGTTYVNISAATEAVVNGFNVVTMTTTASHGLEPGMAVTIVNVTPVSYDGTFVVAGVNSATQFTYTNATGSLPAATAFGNVSGIMYLGGTAAGVGMFTNGTSGITLASSAPSVVINVTNVAFSGNQTWNLAAGTLLRFTSGGAASFANGRATSSGNDGNIEISGGGVVSLNPGSGSSFADANSFAQFTGTWQVDNGCTLRSLRNGASAFTASTAANAITLNGGTLAVGGGQGDVGNWAWNTPITLNPATTSYIADQNVAGTGRYLLLTGPITGSGNVVFTDPLVGATAFTSQDLGFILSGNASDTMSGTVTIGGPIENAVPGRLTYLRVGGNATGTATTTGAGGYGSLGSATSVVDNGVLSFYLVSGYTLPCPISGTGTLRIGSLSTTYIGAAYQDIILIGANTYTGPTIINAGKLSLGAGASLANSSSITITTNSVNGTTLNTFDVTGLTGAFTTAPGQTLSLNGGQLNGNFNFAVGSTNILAPGGSNTVGTLGISGNLALSGGTNILVLDINNSANDQISVGGTLTAGGVTKFQFVLPGTGINAGTYTLITAGTMDPGVTAANFAVAGLTAGPRPQTFTVAISGNTVELVVVGSPGNLTWVGDNVNNNWDVGVTTNWYNNLTLVLDKFYNNDQVTFDDTGSASPAINLVTNPQPGSITFNNSANTYTFRGTGGIAGSGTLTINGPGTVAINTSNSFTGGVTLNGGALAITNEAALGEPVTPTAGSLTFNGGVLLTTNTFVLGVNTNRGITISGGGGFDVTNASTLTVSNVIAGGTLTKTGNGTLVLVATNAHSLTVVNGGTVVCGTGKATGTASSWAAGPTIQSGIVDLNGKSNYTPSDGTNNYLFASVVTFGQQTGATSLLEDTVAGHPGFVAYGTSPYLGIIYDGANDPGKATISAPWYGTGTSTLTTRQVQVDTSANAPIGLEFTGTIGQRTSIDGQNTTLEKTGTGVMKISNTNYFPGLKISAGTLITGHVNALGSVRAIANTVTVTGPGSILDLNGFSPTISDLEDGGTSDGTVLNNGASPSTLTVTHNTVISAYSGTLANGASSLALLKAGANTVTLSGTDTYSGGTTVSNGTLVVASPGSLANGIVTVLTNATFSVNGGTVSCPITIYNGGSLSGTNGGTINNPVTVNNGGNVSALGNSALNLASVSFAGTGTMSINVANGGLLDVTTSGGITNNGPVNSITINIVGTAPATGTYQLITYGGSLNGSGYNAYRLGSVPGGASYSLVNNPGVSVNLVVEPAFFWTGAQSSEWSITPVGGLMNWDLAGNPVEYTNGAVVVFDDSLTGTSAVDISAANVTPANVYFNNSAYNYSLQGAAAIAGATAMVKNGSDTLTVINNNTYTGGTTINAGVIQVGTNGTSGTLGSGAIAVVTDLQFNRADTNAVANNISGVGTVEQNGAGALVLSGTNTYTGLTTVNTGTLIVSNANALTVSGMVSNNAAFQVSSSATLGTLISVAGSTVNLQAGTLTYSGSSLLGNLTGNGGLTWKSTADTASSQFTTADALAFNGTLTLRGGTPSTTPANLEGAAGRFWLNSTAGSQLPATAFALDTGSSATNGQDLIIGDWDGSSGNRSLTLSSLTGYGTLRTDTGTTGTRNLTVVQSANTTFNGMILSHNNGSNARSLAFTKDGAGSLTLAGVVGYQTQSSTGTTPLTVTVLNGTLVMAATNTYADATTVSNGVLLVNGVIASPVTVVGGSLGGTGVIQSSVTVQSGGSLFTSQSGLGTLTINTNALTLSAGSTNFMKVSAATFASDLVQGFSSASYDGTLVVSNLSGTLASGQSFQIFSAGGTGNFASIIPTPGTNLNWNFNAASGVLSVASTVAANATNILVSVTGNTLRLSWPTDHLGWILQAQTNALSSGLGTNWVDVSGSSAATSTNLPIVPGNQSVFYRLRHP